MFDFETSMPVNLQSLSTKKIRILYKLKKKDCKNIVLGKNNKVLTTNSVVNEDNSRLVIILI